MSEWYFAYGSNLWIDQMVARTGSNLLGEDQPRVARLARHQLIFNMRGECGSVFANIESAATDMLGAIYRCTPQALAILDEYERGYERRRVSVATKDDEIHEACVYVALPTHIVSGRQPTAEYLRKIVVGARQHGLPEAYIREIERKAAVKAS